MIRKPRPALFTLAAVIVTLVFAALDGSFIYFPGASGWSGWASQLLPHTVRSCMIWMIGCFLVMRQGATSWGTRIVPIGLFVLILSTHALAFCLMQARTDFPHYLGMGLVESAVVNEVSSLVLVTVITLVLSQLLNVSLRQVNCREEITPQRIGIRTILIATTGVAIFLAFQNLLNAIQASTLGASGEFKVTNVITFALSFFCSAAAFFGGIWMIASPKRRWLGLAGMIVWPIAPLEAAYVLSSPTMQMQLRGGTINLFFVFVLVSYALTLLGTMLTIPVFRLFGYQFRIGNQPEVVALIAQSSAKGES